MRASILLTLAVLLGGLPAARGGDWPGFRGPGGTGLTNEKQLPAEWEADKNVQWKVTIPGRGWSCPIVWGDKLFVTTAVTDQQQRPATAAQPGKRPGGFGGRGMAAPDTVYRFEVHCLDRSTGKLLWKQVAQESKPRIPTHSTNTYATETPVTDGERVYAYFGMTGLFCYDFSGKLLWKKDLGSYPMQMGWGTASSPVLDGTRLFLQIDNEQNSFLVALDSKTGSELWKVAQRTDDVEHSASLEEHEAELVASGGQKVISYDPDTGKEFWQLAMGGGQASASPVADGDFLYVGHGPGGGGRGGFGGGQPGGPAQPPGGFGRMGGGGGTLFAVKAGGAGDITPKQGATTSAGVAWSQTRAAPAMASPLVYQGHIYILDRNGGMASCYDAKTGKPAYQRERIPNARAFWSSPWAYDGKVFCLDDAGTTHVLQAGPEFKVLAKNTLSEQFWSSPAVAGGALFLRGVEHLYCIKPQISIVYLNSQVALKGASG